MSVSEKLSKGIYSVERFFSLSLSLSLSLSVNLVMSNKIDLDFCEYLEEKKPC